MTAEQQYFLESLENWLAKLVHDGYGETEEAKNLGVIIELIENDYSVMAYMEAEACGFDERVLKGIKSFFDLRI